MNNPIELSVKKLCEVIVTPYEANPWFDGRMICKEDIADAIEKNKLRAKPIMPWKNRSHEKLMNSYVYHVQRIAYLVMNGWQDAIEIDVGMPALDYYPSEYILDGWHRLAAAIYRKDKTVLCSWSGQEDVVEDFVCKDKRCKSPNLK